MVENVNKVDMVDFDPVIGTGAGVLNRRDMLGGCRRRDDARPDDLAAAILGLAQLCDDARRLTQRRELLWVAGHVVALARSTERCLDDAEGPFVRRGVAGDRHQRRVDAADDGDREAAVEGGCV